MFAKNPDRPDLGLPPADMSIVCPHREISAERVMKESDRVFIMIDEVRSGKTTFCWEEAGARRREPMPPGSAAKDPVRAMNDPALDGAAEKTRLEDRSRATCSLIVEGEICGRDFWKEK